MNVLELADLDYYAESMDPHPSMSGGFGHPYSTFRGSAPIPETDERFWVTHDGRVADLLRDAWVAACATNTHANYPTLLVSILVDQRGKQRTTRSLRKLVADAFLPWPWGRAHTRPTVIQLNHNWRDCHITNLAWRPEWYARRYREQFHRNKSVYAVRTPIKDVVHGYEYLNIYQAAEHQGLMLDEIRASISTGEPNRYTKAIFEEL